MKTALVAAFAFLSVPVCAQELPAPVEVATVAAVSGEVLLAQRASIGPAEPGAVLAAGDRLMTMDRSEVLIAFADGCSRRLDSNSLLAIGEMSDCRQGLQPRSFRQAIGEPGGAAAPKEGMSAGEKTAVAAAILIPALWLWDRNRDDDGREPVSR
jgi:hypothetical protein